MTLGRFRRLFVQESWWEEEEESELLFVVFYPRSKTDEKLPFELTPLMTQILRQGICSDAGSSPFPFVFQPLLPRWF